MKPRSTQLLKLYEGWSDCSLPPGAIRIARMGIFDAVGCIVGGAATPTAALVRELATAQGHVHQSTVLGTPLRLAAPLAALANGVAGHVLDYDDMNSTLLGHPSVVLVPALFALGEAQGSSGRDVLSAYVMGFEVDTWFARFMVPQHYEAGWHSTSSLGIFGAAAGASRLLGLEADGMLNALAIAASNAAGLRANFGSMTKSWHAGQAAEAGLRAALLAQRGFTANISAIDGPGGFIEAYGARAEPKPAPEGLEIEASGLGIKPYACCGAGVSAIDAALEVRRAHWRAADIVAVDCVVNELAHRIMPFTIPNDGLQAKYSLAYCIAVALLDGCGGLEQFEDGRVLREDVQALTRRVRVTPDSSMASGAGLFGLELTVRLADGGSHRAALDMPRGHPGRPLDEAQLLGKFLECVAPVTGEGRAREAAEQLAHLESLPDLEPVLRPLRMQAS